MVLSISCILNLIIILVVPFITGETSHSEEDRNRYDFTELLEMVDECLLMVETVCLEI